MAYQPVSLQRSIELTKIAKDMQNEDREINIIQNTNKASLASVKKEDRFMLVERIIKLQPFVSELIAKKDSGINLKEDEEEKIRLLGLYKTVHNQRANRNKVLLLCFSIFLVGLGKILLDYL